MIGRYFNSTGKDYTTRVSFPDEQTYTEAERKLS